MSEKKVFLIALEVEIFDSDFISRGRVGVSDIASFISASLAEAESQCVFDSGTLFVTIPDSVVVYESAADAALDEAEKVGPWEEI